MEYRRFGRTELRISALGFGAGQLQILEREEAVALMAKAVEAGINYIDIDRHNDETLIGEVARQTGKTILYAGKSFATSAQLMRSDIASSMKRFDCSTLDMYCLHMVLDRGELDRRLKGAMKTLLKAKEDGVVRAIGISGHRIPVLGAALETGHFDYVVVPYNITHRIAEDLFRLTRAEDLGVMTFMTFGGGVLVDPGWSEEGEVALGPDDPLRFSLSNEDVHSIVVGTNKDAHLAEMIEYTESFAPMNAEEIEAKEEEIFELLGSDFCRGCRFCIRDGIPFVIEVDKILRLKTFAERLDGIYPACKEYKKMNARPEHFEEGIDPEFECPFGLDVLAELRAAHELLTNPPKPKEEEPTAFVLPPDVVLDLAVREYRDKIGEYEEGDPGFEATLALLREKMEEDPKNPIPVHHVGELFMEAARFELAIEWLKKAVAMRDKINWSHFSIAKCLVKLGNHEEALKHLEENLRMCTDPLSHFHSWYFKAICYHALGQADRVEVCLAKASTFEDLYGEGEIPEEIALLEALGKR